MLRSKVQMTHCEVVEMRNSADTVGYLCSRTASTQCSDCGSELCESHKETCGICNGMFCSGLGLPCFTDDEDQHLQVKICSCPWSLINDSMLFFTPLPIPQRIPCRRQESSTGFPIRTESSVATSMHNKIRVLRVLRYVCLDRQGIIPTENKSKNGWH